MLYMGYLFDSPFALDGKRAIIRPKDLGIVNEHITVGTPQTTAAGIAGMYAPPFASSNFEFDLRVMGELIHTEKWAWQPNAIYRMGTVNELTVETLSVLTVGKRCMVLAVDITNNGGKQEDVFLQAWISGGLDFVHQWTFSKPDATKEGDVYVAPKMIRKINNDKAWSVGTDLDGMLLFPQSSLGDSSMAVAADVTKRYYSHINLWENTIALSAGETKRFYFDMALGTLEDAVSPADREAEIAAAFAWLTRRTEELFETVPHLSSDDKRLERYYNRSLVHYITNRWMVKDLVMQPYYSNCGINGACMNCYLWDYSGGWSLHPLVDPEANKAHIRQFFHIDLTRSYAFTPVDGAACGPWYQINQEKIIALVYYQVKYNGDIAFLDEIVDGKTILEHVLEQAWIKDSPERDVQLCDYGVDGEDHLELKKGYPYHGVMPDLNARRYMNYIRAAELLELKGGDASKLREHAAQLKKLVREQLWDDDINWFHFIPNGQPDTRYTVQMFKLIGSPVLDDDMLEGLISHLSDREFLSQWGLHSISKQDPAYDQLDVDNGGGGTCTLFIQLIAEKLYQSGHPREANLIMLRTLWWADRMPYWGDAFMANALEYRYNTTFQCAIGAVSGAQALIFGLCGIAADFDGTVTITPARERLAHHIALTDVKLRGKRFDLELDDGEFIVRCAGKIYRAQYGETVTLK